MFPALFTSEVLLKDLSTTWTPAAGAPVRPRCDRCSPRTRRARCTCRPCSSSGFLRKLGGQRPVPAATAFAGRHDPRLAEQDGQPVTSRRCPRMPTAPTDRSEGRGHGPVTTSELIRADGATGETPALEARNVTVRFGGLVALSDVSISVPPATIVGLVGPNGAGQDHAVRRALRPAPPAGRRRVPRRATHHARCRRRSAPASGLARTFQQLELFMGLTVREHVVLAYRVRNQRNRLWSDLVTAGALHRESTAEQRPGRPPRRAARPHERRAHAGGIAAARHSPGAWRSRARSRPAPSVVLLDEPSSGLDRNETGQLGAALRTRRRGGEGVAAARRARRRDGARPLELGGRARLRRAHRAGHARRDPRRPRGSRRVPRRRRSRRADVHPRRGHDKA